MAGDTERLAAPWQSGNVAVNVVEGEYGAAPFFDPPVAFIQGPMAFRGGAVKAPDIVIQRRSVALRRKDVIAALLDDRTGGLRATRQGVEGDGTSRHAEFAQQPAPSEAVCPRMTPLPCSTAAISIRPGSFPPGRFSGLDLPSSASALAHPRRDAVQRRTA